MDGRQQGSGAVAGVRIVDVPDRIRNGLLVEKPGRATVKLQVDQAGNEVIAVEVDNRIGFVSAFRPYPL
jgi:hypothetical protein